MNGDTNIKLTFYYSHQEVSSIKLVITKIENKK